MAKKTKQQPAGVFYLTTTVTITRRELTGRIDFRGNHILSEPIESTFPAGTELHFIRDEFFPLTGWTKVFKVADQAQWLRLSADQVSETPVTLEVQS